MKKFASIILITSLLIIGCNKAKSEKQKFIDATVETACLVFQQPDLDNLDIKALEEKTKEIFKKHGFEVQDEAAMQALTDKYTMDKEVQDALTKALEECAGDLTESLGKFQAELNESMPAAGEESVDEAVVEEQKTEDAVKAE